MNRFPVFAALLIAGCTMESHTPSDDPLSALKGHYLGQEPPGLTPEIFAPGIVSTKDLEISGVFSSDLSEFYFSRQSAGGALQSYVLRYVNGAWLQSEFEGDTEGLFLSPDGNTMHLGSAYRERTSAGWSERKSLGPPFDEIPIMRLSASGSGTYVFDEREEIGTLRYSRITTGKREAPKAFGDEINSGKWTAHPFIAVDESYLIWDSERAGGYGETDLYISFRQQDGSWGKALNMGAAINSEYEDGVGTVTPDGAYFFFNRVDLGASASESEANIYWVDAQIIETLRTTSHAD